MREDAAGQHEPPRAVARRALRRRVRGPVDHERAAGDERDHRRDRHDHADRPVAGDERDEDGDREQRGEARLRVREEEPGEQHGDERGDQQRAHVAVPERDQQHRDPDDDVPPVQARVAEERGDAEEVRVRVPDLDRGRLEEQAARRLLDDPDDREQHRQADDDRAEDARHPAREVGARPTTATISANGIRKNSSRLRALPEASDQSSDSEAKARNAAAGQAISRGSGAHAVLAQRPPEERERSRRRARGRAAAAGRAPRRGRR